MKKFNKNDYTIETNDKGELASFLHKGKEILFDGREWWPKTFPIIFPVVGFTRGFEHEGVNYEMPKHGFWKELDWTQELIENGIRLTTVVDEKERYPFKMEIVNDFLINDGLEIKTSIKNVSEQTAYFHFGYHPAFEISRDATLSGFKQQANMIDVHGKLVGKTDWLEKPIMEIPFDSGFDTLVIKDVEPKTLTIHNKEYDLVTTFNSPSVQIWKPHEATFVCIEPWHGTNDDEMDLITVAKDKNLINSVEPGNVFNSWMKVQIKEK